MKQNFSLKLVKVNSYNRQLLKMKGWKETIPKLVRGCSIKKVLLKISQNSQENKIPVPESFFSKVAGLRPTTLFKKDSGTDVFL